MSENVEVSFDKAVKKKRIFAFGIDYLISAPINTQEPVPLRVVNPRH